MSLIVHKSSKPVLTRRNRVVPLPKGLIAHSLRPQPTNKSVRVVNTVCPVRPQTPPSKAVAQARPLPTNHNAVVLSRPRSLTKPKVRAGNQPKYITPDVEPQDLELIRSLRGIGKGRLLVIIANGPSVSEVEIGKLRNVPEVDLLSINKPDSRAWPTRFWMFVDNSQLARHKDLLKGFNGYVINSTSMNKVRPNTIKIKNLGGQGFSFDLTKGMNIGRSTTFASMQVGLWMGYDHIYLFGVDMAEVGGKLHFYGVNPDVAPEERKSRFSGEATYYDEAAKVIPEAERKRFTFCSSYLKFPFAEKFGKMDHLIAVHEVLDHANRLNAAAHRMQK